MNKAAIQSFAKQAQKHRTECFGPEAGELNVEVDGVQYSVTWHEVEASKRLMDAGVELYADAVMLVPVGSSLVVAARKVVKYLPTGKIYVVDSFKLPPGSVDFRVSLKLRRQ